MEKFNKKNLGRLALITFVIVFTYAFASGQQISATANPPADSGLPSFGRYIGLLPNSDLKSGLMKYLEIIGLHEYRTASEVGGQNTGITSYFDRLNAESSCFARLRAKLYTDISGSDTRYFTAHPESRPLDGRPSIGEVSGVRSNGERRAGWAWRKAMELADEDPSLAMHLLGSIGHDDVAFSRQSRLFVPQSLGVRADISPQLKRRIVEIQSPESKDPNLIPAKYYHVIGGAFMACAMIAEGVPTSIAIEAERTASLFYRSIRICSEIKSLKAEEAELIAAIQELMPSGHATDIENSIKQELLKYRRSGQCPPGKPKLCIVLQKSNKASNSDETFRRYLDKVSNTVVRIVVARIFEREFVGGESIAGQTVPCMPQKSPQAILEALRSFRAGFDTSCGSSYSSSTCQKARAKVDTWLIDFEWTAEQHEAGAKFAAENCRKNPEGYDLNRNACQAVAKHGAAIPPLGAETKSPVTSTQATPMKTTPPPSVQELKNKNAQSSETECVDCNAKPED